MLKLDEFKDHENSLSYHTGNHQRNYLISIMIIEHLNC